MKNGLNVHKLSGTGTLHTVSNQNIKNEARVDRYTADYTTSKQLGYTNSMYDACHVCLS